MSEKLASLRAQMVALNAELDAGKIDAKAYAAKKQAIEQQIIAAVTAPDAGEAPDTARVAGPKPLVLVGLAAAVLVIAGAGYFFTGKPNAQAEAAAAAAEAPEGTPHQLGQEQILAMTESLAQKLRDNPNNPEGWAMLGRSYMVLGKPNEAVAAYEQSYKLHPDDPAMLADYADALGLKNGRSLEGEPYKLVLRALKLDSKHIKALMLAGTAAYNQNDFAKAAEYWDRVVAVAPVDHPMVQQAASAAQDAREKGKLAPAKAVTPAPAPAQEAKPVAKAKDAATAEAAVSGTVTLSDSLKSQVSPEDTVFIFARPPEGSRMPLAILRKQVKDLPFQFTLDDKLAMSPSSTLSSVTTVVVGARVSKSGQAMPRPGDFEGLSGKVAVGSKGLKIEINDAVK